MPDTPDDILAQRMVLETALANANERYSDACTKRGEAQTARGRALFSAREMKAALAQGKATDDDAQEMVDWSTVCDEEFKIHYEAANDALDAIKQTEWQLETLLATHPDVFAEQAEHATQAALVALKALSEPVRKAQMAYDAAVAAWAPVARAMGIPPVPDWPFVHPDDLANPEHLAPRPSKVIVNAQDPM
jgi:hypothetical protein